MSKPADLCQYDLPNGNLCRQVALKGEQVCRHHRRLFRHSEAEMLHDEAMDRLAAQLRSLDLFGLLRALQTKLNRIQSVVRADPEARLALNIALERLQKRKEANLAFRHFANQNPMPDPDSPEFKEMMEKHANSMR